MDHNLVVVEEEIYTTEYRLGDEDEINGTGLEIVNKKQRDHRRHILKCSCGETFTGREDALTHIKEQTFPQLEDPQEIPADVKTRINFTPTKYTPPSDDTYRMSIKISVEEVDETAEVLIIVGSDTVHTNFSFSVTEEEQVHFEDTIMLREDEELEFYVLSTEPVKLGRETAVSFS